MIATLVWLLITGREGGHVSPAQFGPFVDRVSCQSILDLPSMRLYERGCVQVNMYIIPQGAFTK